MLIQKHHIANGILETTFLDLVYNFMNINTCLRKPKHFIVIKK